MKKKRKLDNMKEACIIERERRKENSMNIGEKIMNQIIESSLVSAVCTENESHSIVLTWSSAAAEQLEALVNSQRDIMLQSLQRQLNEKTARCEIFEGKTKKWQAEAEFLRKSLKSLSEKKCCAATEA